MCLEHDGTIDENAIRVFNDLKFFFNISRQVFVKNDRKGCSRRNFAEHEGPVRNLTQRISNHFACFIFG